MDNSALRQQILSSNNTASEKADIFVWKRKVNDEQNLIAGIPEDVEKCIGMLKSEGTQLYLAYMLDSSSCFASMACT